MSYVAVDASVVVKLLFQEPYSAEASALLTDAARAGQRIVSPYLMPVEVTNVIRKRMRRDRLTLSDVMPLVRDMVDLPIDLLELSALHERALALTAAHSLGAHDAHYVALAEILQCELWADDGRLLRAVRGRLGFVRWIGDYQASGTA